jgi:hypothetical protein
MPVFMDWLAGWDLLPSSLVFFVHPVILFVYVYVGWNQHKHSSWQG